MGGNTGRDSCCSPDPTPALGAWRSELVLLRRVIQIFRCALAARDRFLQRIEPAGAHEALVCDRAIASGLLQVELATERLQVLRTKLRVYAEALARPAGLFGWQDFGLGFALGDDRRQAEIKALIAREWDGWSLVWTLAEGPERQLHGLITELQGPLTDSPCGEGRRSAASAGGATAALDERGGLSEE